MITIDDWTHGKYICNFEQSTMESIFEIMMQADTKIIIDFKTPC